ncbi:ABC transporter permease subunit [Metamycoplasma hyosynoviae]|uniref:ABC transporter permease subunit n=1 Tax=Metamycoplasma hyosynoviae TaxID=29559 RepID=UPI0023590732|nr:ABC transporter permease subunit [Metamycoplasma hyosynoviae]MDC8915593.1 ABC transporter permease subunit [Metamycoplasma hyosynoviae]MDC8917578.1 ABC transporter permease subunit [Metamycoplasma hyosynoviae]MDD7907850.1 ABC transporter permease subunit [Metamycoplasma hyosynoviae]MDI3063687.1 ABC transporter permease subunit [Metamycoplasma hyosynoviae]
MNKTRKILTRIGIYTAIFFVSIILIYFLINLVFENQIKKNLAVYSQIEKNIFFRFGAWIKRFFTNEGKIYSYELNANNLSIPSLYLNQFKWTLLFTILVFIISFFVGNALGIYSAYKFNKTSDILINFIITLFATFPLIIIGIVLLVLSNTFKYPSQFILSSKYTFISILVPILITSFGSTSLFFSRARKLAKEIITSNFYIFHKSLGLSQNSLIKKCLLKNIFIYELQVIIPFYLLLFSSSMVIERIFSIPGQSIFLAYAFKHAEMDLILFYFVWNLSFLLITKFIFSIVLIYINPMQKDSTLYDLSFIRIRKAKLWTR